MYIMTKDGWKQLYTPTKSSYITIDGKQYHGDYRKGFKLHIVRRENGLQIIDTVEDYIAWVDEEIYRSKLARGAL